MTDFLCLICGTKDDIGYIYIVEKLSHQLEVEEFELMAVVARKICLRNSSKKKKDLS